MVICASSLGKTCGSFRRRISGHVRGRIEDDPQCSRCKSLVALSRNSSSPRLLDECVQKIQSAGEVKIATFSCTFFQTISSLALGRRLKQAFPEIKITYGGACFHDEMGEELIHKIPWIDGVSVGETDDVIVPFFQALLENRPPENLQGILYRHGSDEVKVSAPYQPVTAKALLEQYYERTSFRINDRGCGYCACWSRSGYFLRRLLESNAG